MKKENIMDTANNNSTETVPTPAAVPAPAATNAVATTAPEATAAPAVTPAPAVTATPAVAAAPVTTAAPAAPAPAKAAPVEIFRGVIPQTNGTTVGGWNRFAGYNPNDAKNKSRDGRGGSQGRR